MAGISERSVSFNSNEHELIYVLISVPLALLSVYSKIEAPFDVTAQLSVPLDQCRYPETASRCSNSSWYSSLLRTRYVVRSILITWSPIDVTQFF